MSISVSPILELLCADFETQGPKRKRWNSWNAGFGLLLALEISKPDGQRALLRADRSSRPESTDNLGLGKQIGAGHVAAFRQSALRRSRQKCYCNSDSNAGRSSTAIAERCRADATIAACLRLLFRAQVRFACANVARIVQIVQSGATRIISSEKIVVRKGKQRSRKLRRRCREFAWFYLWRPGRQEIEKLIDGRDAS